MSIAFENYVSEPVDDAIKEALSKGIIVVAGAGNSTVDNDKIGSTPAATTGVIAAATSGMDDDLADFSNFGRRVALSAPGVSIKTLYPIGMIDHSLKYSDSFIAFDDQYYGMIDGTLFSSPMVAGTIFLMLQKQRLNGAAALSLLQQTANTMKTSKALGSGRINVDKVLETIKQEIKDCTTAGKPLDVTKDGFISPIDALHIINVLNGGAPSSTVCYDSNADGIVDAKDALAVLNYLNLNISGGN